MHALYHCGYISVWPEHKPQAIWVHRIIQAHSPHGEDRHLVSELGLDKVNFQCFFQLK